MFKNNQVWQSVKFTISSVQGMHIHNLSGPGFLCFFKLPAPNGFLLDSMTKENENS